MTLKQEDLEKLSADELLELDVEEIEELKFIMAPEAVFQAEMQTELVTRQINGTDTPVVSVKLTLTSMEDFDKGPNGEPLEELADEEGNVDLPDSINFSYFLNSGFGVRQFRTDWTNVAREVTDENINIGKMIELLNGLSVEFTHVINRKKDKDTGEVKKYSKVKNATLLTV